MFRDIINYDRKVSKTKQRVFGSNLLARISCSRTRYFAKLLHTNAVS